MGVCNSRDNGNKRMSNLEKQYPQFYKKPNNVTKFAEDYKDNETELIEQFNKFISNKNELEKSNSKLYSIFFDEKINRSDTFSYSGLQPDEDDRFHYFFNLLQNPYKKVHLTNSNITFPKFTKNTFPEFKNKKSALESISITSSKVLLDKYDAFYSYIDECKQLDLSFNNIPYLPDGISKLTKLTYLNLRRNKLRKLPESFKDLKNLVELDLSENKFTGLVKEVFSSNKLEKLNMNSNELETFKYVGPIENINLKFLFLSQNKLTTIPSFVIKLPKIQFINLDENQILDIDPNLNEEIENDKIEISLHNNSKNFDNLVLTKPNMNFNVYSALRSSTSIKFTKKHSSKTIVNSEGGSAKNSVTPNDTSSIGTKNRNNIPSQNISLSRGEKDRDEIKDNYEQFRIRNPQTPIEVELSGKMEKIIKEAHGNDELKDFIDKAASIQQKRFDCMINILDNYLASGREKEISSIENPELKTLFKKYYLVYLARKEYETTGINTMKKESLELFIEEYITQSDDVENSKREVNENQIKKNKPGDVENLLFLVELNDLISSNKIKIFMQYLANIDDQIKENLNELWTLLEISEEKSKRENRETKETFDKNSLILLLTDLKICLNEMIVYYKKKKKFGHNIDYSFNKMLPQNKTHDIFFNEITRKILKRLGLKNISIKDGKSIHMKTESENNLDNDEDNSINKFIQYIFDFNIVDEMHIKHQQVLNFLERFIGLVKSTR